MCLVMSRWCRIMSACPDCERHVSCCTEHNKCWRVIFMTFKCSLINSGVNQTNKVTSCTDQVLITSDESLSVQVRAERRRTQKLQLSTNHLQLLLWSLSSWDQRNSVFHCSSTKSLTGCLTWTSSDRRVPLWASEWGGAIKLTRSFWQPLIYLYIFPT